MSRSWPNSRLSPRPAWPAEVTCSRWRRLPKRGAVEHRPVRLGRRSEGEGRTIASGQDRRVDAIRLGRTIRALRIRQGLRQKDLGRRARVSQSLVSRIERGAIDSVGLRVVDDLVQKLGGDLRVAIRWRGGDIDRLMDEGHAALMGRAASMLERAGWSVRPEVTFANYSDRGSIDLLAWHPGTSTVVVVEIKTELTSIEETLRTHDMKTRNALKIARERAGWVGRVASRLLVLPDSSTTRRRANRHDLVLRRAYPITGVAARAWIREPTGAVGILMFLPLTTATRGRCGPVGRRRVRVPESGSATHDRVRSGTPTQVPGPDSGTY
ncbi:MAG: helix-turn-helix transcriptional regulator [Chloroflexota bacterium]